MVDNGDWGLGIGDWGLGIGDWAQSPIPKTQIPTTNPQNPIHHILKNNKNKIVVNYNNLRWNTKIN